MRTALFLFLAGAACVFHGTAQATPLVFGVTFNAGGNAGFIDVATGHFEIVGTVGPLINDVAIAPDGSCYAIANTSELVVINTSNGAITGVMPLPSGIETLDFSPTDHTLFAATQGTLYTIDLASQTTTLIGNYGALGNAQNIRFDSSGNLWTTDTGSPTNVYEIDQSTGTATWEFNVPFGAVALGYVDGRLYGVGISGIGGQGNLVWVDPSTKSGSQLLGSFPSVDFSEPEQHSYTPEPGALWLCLPALAGLAFIRRKRA